MKTTAATLATGLAALFLAAPQPAVAQDAGAVTLKQKLQVGKTYNYRQKMEMKMALPIGGAGESKTTMSMDVGMKVDKAPDGENKLVTTKFDAIKMEMDMAGQKMVYDSTDETKQNPLLKTAFGELGDQSFKAIYDKDDNFVKMEGGGGGAAAAGLGMGMGEKEIEQMLKQLTDYGFPNRPIKPGEKWDHTQEANMGQMGAMEVDMQFTYKGPAEHDGKKVAEIAFTGTVGGGAKAEGALVEFKDSTMNGKMYFDTELGTVRHSVVDMNLTMSVGGAGGAEMDTSTRSTYSLLSVE